MLQALFSTPTGRRTKVMRVRRSAQYAGALAHLLGEHGFTATRETERETWFVRVAPLPSDPVWRTSAAATPAALSRDLRRPLDHDRLRRSIDRAPRCDPRIESARERTRAA